MKILPQFRPDIFVNPLLTLAIIAVILPCNPFAFLKLAGNGHASSAVLKSISSNPQSLKKDRWFRALEKNIW
jgi:hypothetical protein